MNFVQCYKRGKNLLWRMRKLRTEKSIWSFLFTSLITRITSLMSIRCDSVNWSIDSHVSKHSKFSHVFPFVPPSPCLMTCRENSQLESKIFRQLPLSSLRHYVVTPTLTNTLGEHNIIMPPPFFKNGISGKRKFGWLLLLLYLSLLSLLLLLSLLSLLRRKKGGCERDHEFDNPSSIRKKKGIWCNLLNAR